MIKQLTLIFIVLSCLTSLNAQDRHFTQFYSSPLTLNPALTGDFNAKYRIGLINRDQWRSALDNPYRTFAASLEVKFGLDALLRYVKKDKLAVGLVFYNDQVEGVDFRETRMAISLAYHKALDKKARNVLTLGFQAGVAQRNVNFNELVFDDQFNEIDAFDLPTAEGFPVNNFTYGDYSVGLNYRTLITKEFSAYGGVALHHIFQPSVSFFEDNLENRLEVFLDRNLTAHAGFNVALNNKFQLSPRILYLSQGAQFQVNGGANLRIRTDEFNSTAVYVGAWARFANDAVNSVLNDSAILMVGFEINGFLVGLSYDLNTEAISTFNDQQGAFEVSLAYLGEYDNESILCPQF